MARPLRDRLRTRRGVGETRPPDVLVERDVEPTEIVRCEATGALEVRAQIVEPVRVRLGWEAHEEVRDRIGGIEARAVVVRARVEEPDDLVLHTRNEAEP